MNEKLYCEGPIRHLVWVIVVLTVGTLVGVYYYRPASSPAAATPSQVEQRPVARVAQLPASAQTAAQAPGGPTAQAAALDGVAMATPKGGLKLIQQTQAVPGQPTLVQGLPAGTQGQTNPASTLSTVPLENIQEVFNNVAASVKPAVVHLEVVRPDPNGGGRLESTGSGVIIDRRGYVLTNYHVLEDALSIRATTYPQTGAVTYDARIVHSDVRTDMAVIKIQSNLEFPVARLGDSGVIQVGDYAMAIGSPLDLAQTVSLGIVSALRETVQIGGATYYDMIQTDAHINKGNSGGPLVNIYGDVVGINTAIYTPRGNFTGVGFALPINNAKVMLDELNIAQQRFAATAANLFQPSAPAQGSWFGVEGASLSPENAAKLKTNVKRGAWVTAVIVNSPAHLAGIRASDIIVGFADYPVDSMDDLRAALLNTPAGSKVSVRLSRAGRLLDVPVVTTPKW